MVYGLSFLASNKIILPDKHYFIMLHSRENPKLSELRHIGTSMKGVSMSNINVESPLWHGLVPEKA